MRPFRVPGSCEVFRPFHKLLPIVLLPAFTACSQPPLLDRIQAQGRLAIGTVAGPLTCELGTGGPSGLEYHLARRFAHELGVAARFRVYATRARALDALARGEVQMVAAARQPTRRDRRRFRLTRAWGAAPLVFVRANGADDGDPVVVPADSVEAEHLHRAPPAHGVRPLLRSAEALLHAIDQGVFRHGFTNQALLQAEKPFLPRVLAQKREPPALPFVWLFSRQGDTSLVNAANRYLQRQQHEGRLDALWQRHVQIPQHDFVTLRDFWQAVHTRLPRYEALFRRAEQETGIDWRLLAAVGYQESHWRPDAVSPTGVRGLMMLTREAARRQGVTQRQDPTQSILGGARHLRWMERRIPTRITEPDRLWLALAAYNVGQGHLEDARVLTQRQGGNPDRWTDVKRRLPLLANAKVAATLRHGRTRGGEPVVYVENIRFYFRLLVAWDHRRRGLDCTANDYRRRTLKN